MINDDDSWCFSMDTHGYDWELPELPYPCVIFHMGWTIPINGGFSTATFDDRRVYSLVLLQTD